MDIEYVRYLMLYSDRKFPFDMAKSDPGMSESYNRVNKYMNKHGNNRKILREDAREIQSNEDNVYKRMQRDFKSQLERNSREIESQREVKENQFQQPRENSRVQIEQEVLALKRALEEKERELLRAKAANNNNEIMS
jgi:hypothetical protein